MLFLSIKWFEDVNNKIRDKMSLVSTKLIETNLTTKKSNKVLIISEIAFKSLWNLEEIRSNNTLKSHRNHDQSSDQKCPVKSHRIKIPLKSWNVRTMILTFPFRIDALQFKHTRIYKNIVRTKWIISAGTVCSFYGLHAKCKWLTFI